MLKKVSLIKQGKVGVTAVLSTREGKGHLTPIESDKGAFFAGFREGVEEGHRRGLVETGSFISLLQTIVKRLYEHKEEVFFQLKADLVTLAMIVCEKVIRKELSDPTALVKLIDTELLSIAPQIQGEVVNIILSPEDLIVLEKHLGRITYDKREIKRLRFLADPLLKRGDFRIESLKSLLNCSIQRELDDLKHTILQG